MRRTCVNPSALWLSLAALGLSLLVAGCGPKPESTGDAVMEKPAGPAGALPFPAVSGSGVAMVFIPGGEFVMGSDEAGGDEAPAHRVRVDSFLMDAFEVTHEQFTKVQLPNPSKWQDDPRKPVNQVRWRDAKQYCNERSLAEGLQPCYAEKTPGWPCDFAASGYRLPTEAEWEYAARAGASGPVKADAATLRQTAWFEENSGGHTHVVGTRRPNAWGLHDLMGNVSEWCQDAYDPDYYKTSPGGNPTGPADTAANAKRSLRGGSWKASSSMCRVTFRQGQQTGDGDACFFTDFCGFRCVRRITADEAAKLRVPQ